MFIVKFICCLSMALLGISISLCAQHKNRKYSKAFCTPGISGMTPSKGISYEKNIVPSYRLTSISNLDDRINGNGSDRVSTQERIKLKLKAPLWNADGLKVIMGFRYVEESFEFDDDQPVEVALHQDLSTHHLRALGTEINVLKPFRGNSYFVFRSAVSFSGLFENLQELNSNYLNYSVSSLYAKKYKQNLEMGLGVYYSNALGIQNIYPILLYNHNFRDKWGIEALLPKRLALRRNITEKQLLSFTISGESARYYLPSERVNVQDVDLRMDYTDVKIGFSYQREIFSILWGGIDVGYRENIDLGFAQNGASRRNFIYRSNAMGGAYVDFSLYITPPKKFRR